MDPEEKINAAAVGAQLGVEEEENGRETEVSASSEVGSGASFDSPLAAAAASFCDGFSC